MASQVKLTSNPAQVIVRAAAPLTDLLWPTLFDRYPYEEWATFARFGWRETREGLVLTLAGLDTPGPSDLNDAVSHVMIHEPYSLRVALEAERHRLAVGVIHSHPAGYATWASPIDDDMDAYYSDYFSGFAPNRPYISLIFASQDGVLSGTGRVFWKQRWHPVHRFAIEHRPVTLERYSPATPLAPQALERVARLATSFGDEAAARLARSTVAVIGAGGTGSLAIELLARAGVGHLIVVDPDVFSPSNHERLHGSWALDVGTRIPKVVLAQRHIHLINPDCRVTAIQGRLPQPEIVDAVTTADVMLGCTDQTSSRLALSDIALRYLIPTIDCGVALEGEGGHVTGQVIQLTCFSPKDPCILCRGMVNQRRLDQELMTDAERASRRAAAEAAQTGEQANGYWQELPQIHTVGYLTTTAAALATGYAIGWLTERFPPPFSRLQLDLGAPGLGVGEPPDALREYCTCRRVYGTADQGVEDAFITPPPHWPPVQFYGAETLH